jgi:hypothetical protein
MTFLRRLELRDVKLSTSFMEDAEDLEVTVRASWNKFQGSSMAHCRIAKKEFPGSSLEASLQASALNNLQEFLDKLATRLEPLLTKESFDNWFVGRVQNE